MFFIVLWNCRLCLEAWTKFWCRRLNFLYLGRYRAQCKPCLGVPPLRPFFGSKVQSKIPPWFITRPSPSLDPWSPPPASQRSTAGPGIFFFFLEGIPLKLDDLPMGCPWGVPQGCPLPSAVDPLCQKLNSKGLFKAPSKVKREWQCVVVSTMVFDVWEMKLCFPPSSLLHWWPASPSL